MSSGVVVGGRPPSEAVHTTTSSSTVSYGTITNTVAYNEPDPNAELAAESGSGSRMEGRTWSWDCHMVSSAHMQESAISFLLPNPNIHAEDVGRAWDTHLMPGIRVIPFTVSVHEFVVSVAG